MDSSSSSSSSSLVVDILYRLDKLHVAASVYGNGIERSVLYNSILLYCFIYMYIYNVYRFSFCLFILFLYIYIFFLWRERKREDPCHDKRKREEFDLFREYFFGLFTSLVWFF